MRHPRRGLRHCAKADNTFVTVLDPKRDRCGGEVRADARSRRRASRFAFDPAAHTRPEGRGVAAHPPDPPTRDRRADEAPRGRPACSQVHTDPRSRTRLDEPPAKAKTHRVARSQTAHPPHSRDERRQGRRSPPQSSVADQQLIRHEYVPPVRVVRSPPNSPHRSTLTPTQPRSDDPAAKATSQLRSCAPDCPIGSVLATAPRA